MQAKAAIGEKFPAVFGGIPAPTKLEMAKMAFPLFGGAEGDTTDTTATTTSTTDAGKSTATTDSTASSTTGGSETTTDKAVVDPKIAEDLQNQIKQTQAQLDEAQKTIKSYTDKEEQATRATKSKEENLQKDLETAKATVAQMESIIRHVATVNAIQGLKDYEFQNVDHVMMELQDDEYQVDVDLEKGRATVSGIENAIKRIAQKETWLVKPKTAEDDATKPPVRRASGVPPAGGAAGGASSKGAAKRAELIKRFPVLGNAR